MIQIRDYKVLKSLLQATYHPKMIALAIWIVHRYSNATITSGWREEKVWSGDSGIHGTFPCRALDWSVKDWVDPQAVARDINENWQYDPTRPDMKCAIVHDIGQGLHLHTQVHERTKYLNGQETIVDSI